MRILLADDDAQIREYVADVLEEAGYNVRAVARVDEAVALLRGGEAFDLVVADVVMPDGGGLELARRMRVIRPELKILLTTGYTRHIAPDLPVNAELVEKPFQRDTLLHAIGNLLAPHA